MGMSGEGAGRTQPDDPESPRERENRRWEEAIRPYRERFPDPSAIDARVAKRRGEGWSIQDVLEELAELAEDL